MLRNGQYNSKWSDPEYILACRVNVARSKHLRECSNQQAETITADRAKVDLVEFNRRFELAYNKTWRTDWKQYSIAYTAYYGKRPSREHVQYYTKQVNHTRTQQPERIPVRPICPIQGIAINEHETELNLSIYNAMDRAKQE